MKIGILESNRIISTLLLVLALTNFEEIHSFPIRKPSQSKIDVLTQRDGKESRNSNVRSRRDIGLVGVNETAAGIIYHVNERKYRQMQK